MGPNMPLMHVVQVLAWTVLSLSLMNCSVRRHAAGCYGQFLLPFKLQDA